VLLLLQGAGLPLALLASGLRHSVWAALGCALLAALAAPEVLRLCLGRGPRAPRRLVFGAEGRMRLDLAGGYSCDVLPARRSLIAGPWRVLVLSGGGTSHRVLVDASRAEAATLAALGRCLARLAAGPFAARPALDSAVTGLLEPARPGS
jgi:hypothetical protein